MFLCSFSTSAEFAYRVPEFPVDSPDVPDPRPQSAEAFTMHIEDVQENTDPLRELPF
jgi:hypothetical protein